MAEPSIKEALAEGRELIRGSETPVLDAELLLARVLGKSREYLYTWPERCLSEAQWLAFHRHCQRRAKGHPIAYLLGEREFWKMTLKVDSRVLIPRPDTELLVELVLKLLPLESARVADLGTGSGAIALALALERPQWQVTATDISAEALAVAKENARALGLSKVDFRGGSWCEPLGRERFDLIVSNPPYIEENDPHLQQGDVRFEPALALVAQEEGLADLREIAQRAPGHLQSGGWLLLEHGYRQGAAVRRILNSEGYRHVQSYGDLAGHERVSVGQTGEREAGHES